MCPTPWPIPASDSSDVMPKFVLLWTDAFVFLALAGVLFQVWRLRRDPTMASGWRHVIRRPSAMAAGVVLACFALIGVLDRSEEHTSELQSHQNLVCSLLH